jgi:hypothetical protein
MLRNRKETLFTIISMLIVVAMGLFFKYYKGIASEWFNNSFSTLFYEIFWCLFIFLWVRQPKSVKKIPIWVFIGTCIIEFLQLWKPPLLQQIRATFVGRMILGTTFVWSDFIYYIFGSLLGWLWLWQLQRLCNAKKAAS